MNWGEKTHWSDHHLIRSLPTSRDILSSRLPAYHRLASPDFFGGLYYSHLVESSWLWNRHGIWDMWWLVTRDPRTNRQFAPEKMASQKEISIPTIHFQVRKCYFQGGHRFGSLLKGVIVRSILEIWWIFEIQSKFQLLQSDLLIPQMEVT